MRRSIRHLVSVGAAFTLTLSPIVVSSTGQTSGASATTDPVAELERDLDAILDEHGEPGAQASVLVHDADGEELYARGSEKRLLPASNTKMLTAAAALDVLGPDHRFTTEVRTDAEQRGVALNGDLYLRGGGDPTLLAEDYDDLAAKVAASGVEVIRGDLVADDTRYDDVRLGWSWGWDDEPFYYSAQISALTVAPDTDYDAGTVIVETTPAESEGEAAEVEVVPDTGYVEITNETETTDGGDTAIGVQREHGTNEIVVSGSIPTDGEPDQTWATVWEPTGYAADVFARALDRHGVRLVGETRLGEPTPQQARSVADHESMPLVELLVPFLKLSNNGHAEVLAKELGVAERDEGSWDAGTEVVRETLADVGVDPDAYRLADGSGLSRGNFISAEQFAALLEGARDRDWFDAFDNGLPVAGEPDRLVGGTLQGRMRGTAAEGNARAKTGSLTGASGLSGYVTSADDEELVFSILHNNYLEADVKHLEDLIVVRLAEFTRDDAGQTGVPDVPRVQTSPGLECSWVKAC